MALRRIRALEEQWEDSARLMIRLVHSLTVKQARIERLQRQIGHARSAIDETRRIGAGDQERHPLLPVWDYAKRLEQGDDPLDVLEWVLSEDYRDGLGSSYGMVEHGPLDDYML